MKNKLPITLLALALGPMISAEPPPAEPAEPAQPANHPRAAKLPRRRTAQMRQPPPRGRIARIEIGPDQELELFERSAPAVAGQPRDLAEQLCNVLPASDLLSRAEVAGPGFINLRMKPSFWKTQLAEILESGAEFGVSDLGGGDGAERASGSRAWNNTAPAHPGIVWGVVVNTGINNNSEVFGPWRSVFGRFGVVEVCGVCSGVPRQRGGVSLHGR